jgi:hypothetical protein
LSFAAPGLVNSRWPSCKAGLLCLLRQLGLILLMLLVGNIIQRSGGL